MKIYVIIWEDIMRITVNSDKDFVKDLRKRIEENDGYCLCALEKIPDTKCICKEFLERTEKGYCSCGLYKKE